MSSSDKKRSRKSKLVPRTFVEVENDGIEVVQVGSIFQKQKVLTNYLRVVKSIDIIFFILYRVIYHVYIGCI